MSEEKNKLHLPESSLTWSFNPRAGVDAPFHWIVTYYGVDAVMYLDSLMMYSPVQAASEAVKFYWQKQKENGVDASVRNENAQDLMKRYRQALEHSKELKGLRLDEDKLLPPELVYQGEMARPKSA